MPTKSFPDFQQFVRRPSTGSSNAKFIGITEFRITDSGTTYVVLPQNTNRVRILESSRTATAVGFYLSGTVDTIVNVDGQTVGTSIVMVSRHDSDLSGYVDE